MSAPLGLTVLLTAFALTGAAAGILALLGAASRGASTPARFSGVHRLDADIPIPLGTLTIELVRQLHLPTSRSGIELGALFLTGDDDHRLQIRSAAPTDHGFIGIITLTGTRNHTHLTYSIVQLPADHRTNPAVLGLDFRIVQALRQIDSRSSIEATGAALHGLDRSSPTPLP